jgi:hypothetical protein
MTTPVAQAALFGGALFTAGLTQAQPQVEFIDSGSYQAYVTAANAIPVLGNYDYGSAYGYVGESIAVSYLDAAASADLLPTLVRSAASTDGLGEDSESAASAGSEFFVEQDLTVRLTWDFTDIDALTDGAGMISFSEDAAIIFSISATNLLAPRQGSVDIDLFPGFSYSVTTQAQSRGVFGEAISVFTEMTIVPETTCLADANGDGQLLPNDFSAWIAAFNAQGPACDQNGDGACLPNDFSAWIANFNAGCD